MERVMEEQTIRGVDTREALEAAIEEVAPTIDWDEEDEDEDGGRAEVAELIEELNEASRAAVEEPWQESVPEAAQDHEDDAFERMERHPLQQQATNLLVEFYDVAKLAEERTTNIDTLLRNAMEVTGGLAQVLPLPPPFEMDDGEAGLSLVQLKRALRGSAFVCGTLFLLRSEKIVSEDEFRRFMKEADAISAQITDLLRSIREARTT
jgi:hypothetical protein